MIEILSTVEGISTAISLVAFVVAISFFGYQTYQKRKEKEYSSLKDDKYKIQYASEWLNLPVKNLKPGQIAELGREPIKV